MPVSVPVNNTSSQKIGTCPHGLPAGACPICNGLAGGNSTTKRDIPRNPGEMTYNECAAVGAMLKALKQSRERAQQNEQNRLQAMANFNKSLEIALSKIQQWSQLISEKTPVVISRPINFVLNKIIIKTLNFIKNLPEMLTVIRQKIADISDKIAAIFGEKKTAISRKISEIFNKLKLKLKSLFFIFETRETNDEEKKIQEDKRIFNLKTFISKLRKKDKKDKDNDS